MVAKLTIGVLLAIGIVFTSQTLFKNSENNELTSDTAITESEETAKPATTLFALAVSKPLEELGTTAPSTASSLATSSTKQDSTTTSKPEPKTTTTQATNSTTPTTAAAIEIVNLPYNPHCEDTPDAGTDDSFIKTLFWNCYLRSYELGQVSEFELTDFKNIVSTQGRDYLLYDVILESAEFACLVGAGSCEAIDPKPPIAPNKQGRCGTVHEYDPDEGAGASLIRLDHACNK